MNIFTIIHRTLRHHVRTRRETDRLTKNVERNLQQLRRHS